MKPRFVIWLGFLLGSCAFGQSLSPSSPLSGPRAETAAFHMPTATPEQEAELNLDQLIQELFHSNPDLGAAKKRLEAFQARPPQEGSLPDPRITMGWISNGYPYPGAGLGVEPTANVGFQLSQGFPYPGKRTLKTTIARKEAESTAMDLQTMERYLVKQLKIAYYELGYVYESIDLLKRNREVLQRLARAADNRYSLGRGTQQDLIKAQLELTLIDKKLLLEQRKKGSFKAEINTLLNRAPDEALGRPPRKLAGPTLGSMQELQRLAEESSPRLKSQRALIDEKQFRVQLARREYYPDFDVMGGYYNMGVLKDMWEFKVQMNIPIFYWRKQRLGLEESAYRLAEAQRSYRASELELSYRVRDQFLAAQTAQSLLEIYQQRLLPQSQLALESSLTSYETGAVDFLTVLSNFGAILENEKDYYEQRTEYLKAMANLEEAVAMNLSSDKPQEAKP
ncbi:MAG: TolC family protein [Terriglobia bacterium]